MGAQEKSIDKLKEDTNLEDSAEIALYIERLRDVYLQSTTIYTPDKTIESTRQ